MPSTDPFSIGPAVLARLIRKNEIIAEHQIRAALKALRHPSKDLSKKAQSLRIRAATAGLLERWPDEYRRGDASFHPGAVDAFGLVCRMDSAHSSRFSSEILWTLEDNWWCRSGVSGSKALMLNGPDATGHCNSYCWRYTTAKILLTSAWIDLRERDEFAAESWQVNASKRWPYGLLTCQASYRTSSGEHVLAVVPAGNHDQEFPECFVRDLNRMRRHARDRGQTLEIYCLNFPTRTWPGRKSKYAIRCERELEEAYFEAWKALQEVDYVIGRWLEFNKDSPKEGSEKQ